MRIPLTPPSYSNLMEEILNDSTHIRIRDILSARVSPEPNGNYYHWDKLRYLNTAPDGFSHKEWWLGIKLARNALYQELPHTSKNGEPFIFAETNSMRRLLHKIDFYGGGELKSKEQIANPNTKETYLVNSLIEEAITSSQLEGASTTQKVAKEMLREKRQPRDRSEQMIVNNYLAMEFINEIGHEDLTPEIILNIQKILTANTLDNKKAIGNWRDNNDVYVGDERDATILHVPPDYKEISHRINKLCHFANAPDKNLFLHPVIKAVLLHFLLAYDHPFEDGNGRTARALFYWSMLRQGYWTMEFVSISRILKKAPAKYTRSYLYTETDQFDVTYFILYQLNVILRSIEELLDYFNKKSIESRNMENLIRNAKILNTSLNHRQLAILNRALKDPSTIFTIESHRMSHNVTYQTSRTDLLELEGFGLLNKNKRSNAFIFQVPEKLRDKIESMT